QRERREASVGRDVACCAAVNCWKLIKIRHLDDQVRKEHWMPELEPWYRVAVPRDEVRQGRSFNPVEFAIHLEQVVAKKGTEDYRDPEKFFLRNVFTRAL